MSKCKNLLLGAFFILTPFFSFSQENKYKINYKGNDISISEKVVQHFGSERVSKSVAEGKEDMIYWDFYVKNAYNVVGVSNEKANEAFQINTFKYSNKFNSKPASVTKENFNILDFEIKQGGNSYGVLLDDNTMIVVKSKEQFNKEFNKYITSLK